MVKRKSFLLLIFCAYKDFSSSFIKQNKRCTSERDLLLLAFSGALILFMANLPVQLATASTDISVDKKIYVGMIGFVSVFFVPLFLYFSSWFIFVSLKVFGGSASFYELRLALFWSLNVSAPLVIVNGLLRGFFFDHENIIYVSFVLQTFVAWIVSNMVAEAEGFKSKFPIFFILTLFIALPQYLPQIIS